MLNFLRKQMKWVMAIIVVAFLLSTFLMYEGRSTRRTPGRNPDGSMTDYEVAQINGRSLMRSELENRLRNYLSTYSTRSAASLDMPAIYQAVLDQAVIESQMAKEVEALGISVSDADADRAMKNYADQYYPTRETFYQALANSGIKVDDYKRSLARQMANDQLLRMAVGIVIISEDKAVEFYDTMKTLLYTTPEGYNLHMADFKTESDAEFMRAKLEAGEKWEEIASSDVLASHDVINVTHKPVFLPATTFSTGAFKVLASLDVGKVSPVFAVSSEDFAVAVKTEHVDASVKPYSEVSGDIKNLLTSQEERKKLEDYQKYLLERAQLVINDKELFARPVVSEDKAPAVEDVIPELAQTEPVSAEPKAAEEAKPEETPAVVEETKPEETPAVVIKEPKPIETPIIPEETPAVVEEAKPEETPAVVEETKPAETPAVVEEAKPAETPAVVEEAKPEETPAVVEEAKPAETPAVVEEAKPEETPAVVEEAAKPAETPAVVEETKPAETPAVVEEAAKPEETPAVVEETKPEVEAVTASQDMPLQEQVTQQ